MTFHEKVSNPLPGTTITQIGWYCVDNQSETANQLDIFQIALAAGPVYGLVIEVLVLIAVWLYGRGGAARRQDHAVSARHTAATGNLSPSGHPPHRATASEDTLARMKELNELRAQQMISEAEYQ